MLIPETPGPLGQRPIMTAEILQLVFDGLLSSVYPPVERLVDHITSKGELVNDGARAYIDLGIGGTLYRLTLLDLGPDSPWHGLADRR